MKRIITLVGLLLVGCGPEVDTPMNIESRSVNGLEATAKSGRISVTRIGVFEDDLAYDGKRGIYILRDAKSGKEFLGVSGIGISDLGMHMIDESKYPDER